MTLMIAITDTGHQPLGEAASLEEAQELIPGHLRQLRRIQRRVARIELWQRDFNGLYVKNETESAEINRLYSLT